MGDQEVFSNQEERDSERKRRVQKAFDSLHKNVGEPLSKDDEERMLGIRHAVASGDRKKAEEHLSAVRQDSSWLYEELMKHPEISAIMRELSILGF
jgi:hypothetical protein